MTVHRSRAVITILLSLVSTGFAEPQSGGTIDQPTQAQVPANPPPATKMEAFKPAAGSVITFGYNNLGAVKGVLVDVREMRDTKGASVRGLQVEVYQSEHSKDRSFVDADEIPELVKGIDALLEVKSNPTQFENFEVRYATHGELQLTAYNDNRGQIGYSVKAGRLIGVNAFLTATDMRQLRHLFDAASQKLANIK